MITYIDTSSFFKLLVLEEGTETIEKLWAETAALAAARLLQVETHSALAQGIRLGHLSNLQLSKARGVFKALWDEIIVVELTPRVADKACELASIVSLRALDAIHLASAIEVGANIVTSADRRLSYAAQQIGFVVMNPLD